MDRQIAEAAAIPAPEAIEHRILLVNGQQPRRHYAVAAAVAIVFAATTFLASGILEMSPFEDTVDAVGPAHPGVVAIAEVVEEEPAIQPDMLPPDDSELEEGLRRLGLTLAEGEADAYYVGKCHVEGGSDCEHVVLSTPDAHANVMLVPDYPVGERVLVADRRMVALVSPSGSGGYIVVATSAKAAKRMEKLLVRG